MTGDIDPGDLAHVDLGDTPRKPRGLIDPLGTRENRAAGLARWRRALRRRRLTSLRARVTRYESLLDGWHGSRALRAIVHLWRKDARIVSRLFHPKGINDGK